MKINISETYTELSKKVSDIIIEEVNKNPYIHLGLATGSTPELVYKNLVEAYKRKEVSFKNVTTFNLDEYVGISPDHEQSYKHYMDVNLFNHIDINSININMPYADKSNLSESVDNYNKVLEQGIDLQILGIGRNGHIGFNEPGTPVDNQTFIVQLNEQTREDNSRFFKSIDQVPKFAITMGIKNIMRSKRIILLAYGKEKSEAVYEMIYGPVTRNNPASILQLHPNLTIFIDESANTKKAT